MTAGPALETVLAGDPAVELHWRGEGTRRHAIFKHRRRGTYVRISPMPARVWLLCDGQRSAAELVATLAPSGTERDRRRAMDILESLARHELIDLPGPAAARPAPPRTAAESCHRLLTARVVVPHVDAYVAALHRAMRAWAFGRTAGVVAAIVVVCGIAAFLTAAPTDAWRAGDPRLWWIVPLLMISCTLVHEASHALAVKHFGREVIAAGAGWHWIAPVLFVDTSDMLLGSRRERILVSLAGPAADITTASVLALLATVDSPAQAALLVGSALRYFAALANLLPVFESDGYYALADALDRPNLRARSIATVVEALKRERSAVPRVDALYAAVHLGGAGLLLLAGWNLALLVTAAVLGDVVEPAALVAVQLAVALCSSTVVVVALLGDVRHCLAVVRR